MTDNKKKDPASAPKYLPQSTRASMFFGLLAIWAIAMAASQGGWSKLGVLLGLFLAAGAASGIISMLSKDARSKPWQFALMCLVLATAFWFYFSGSYRSWATLAWDIGSIAIGGAVGTAVVAIVLAFRERGSEKKTSVLTTSSESFPVCVMLAGWVTITVVTLIRQGPLPLDVKRFSSIGPATSIVRPYAARWQQVRVGLALSGGGYRAAVFHAGTLHALEKLGIRVSVLSTVSGGSIIGAYYSIGGDPEKFKDAVAEGRFNLKRELTLLHNVARLPFPITLPILNVKLFPWYEFSRRDVQAGLLRRTLFGDDESWRAPGPDQPSLVISTTDLIFGQQIGLMPDGASVIWTDRMSESYRGEAWKLDHDFSLAERVAMSGGFPGAFPAEPVKVSVKSGRGSGLGARPLLLADGGIVDNSGFMMLSAVNDVAGASPVMNATDARMASDIFLVSDAGAIFGVEPELSGLAQVIRAADVSSAMARNGSREGYTNPRVNFSAQDHFPGTAILFRGFNRKGPGSAGMHVSFNVANKYPDSVLGEIMMLMPEAAKKRGFDALRRYQSATKSVDFDHVVFGDVLVHLKPDEPCKPSEKFPGLCDAFELRWLFNHEVTAMLAQFRDVSTLDDLPPRESVENLYALGQLLVYLQWPFLEMDMDAAAARRATAAPM